MESKTRKRVFGILYQELNVKADTYMVGDYSSYKRLVLEE